MARRRRSIGFYGRGTPKVAIFRPVGKPYASAVTPWVQRNGQAPHWSLEFPEGAEWDWCLAFDDLGCEYEVLLCDYKGKEKHEADPLSEAPEEFRDLIARCHPRYRSRAIISTAKRYTLRSGVHKVS